MLQEKFNFRWILNLDVQTGSGSDPILYTGSYTHTTLTRTHSILYPGSGSDPILNSRSDLISKIGSGARSDQNTRPDPKPYYLKKYRYEFDWNVFRV